MEASYYATVMNFSKEKILKMSYDTEKRKLARNVPLQLA